MAEGRDTNNFTKWLEGILGPINNEEENFGRSLLEDKYLKKLYLALSDQEKIHLEKRIKKYKDSSFTLSTTGTTEVIEESDNLKKAFIKVNNAKAELDKTALGTQYQRKGNGEDSYNIALTQDKHTISIPNKHTGELYTAVFQKTGDNYTMTIEITGIDGKRIEKDQQEAFKTMQKLVEVENHKVTLMVGGKSIDLFDKQVDKTIEAINGALEAKPPAPAAPVVDTSADTALGGATGGATGGAEAPPAAAGGDGATAEAPAPVAAEGECTKLTIFCSTLAGVCAGAGVGVGAGVGAVAGVGALGGLITGAGVVAGAGAGVAAGAVAVSSAPVLIGLCIAGIGYCACNTYYSKYYTNQDFCSITKNTATHFAGLTTSAVVSAVAAPFVISAGAAVATCTGSGIMGTITGAGAGAGAGAVVGAGAGVAGHAVKQVIKQETLSEGMSSAAVSGAIGGGIGAACIPVAGFVTNHTCGVTEHIVRDVIATGAAAGGTVAAKGGNFSKEDVATAALIAFITSEARSNLNIQNAIEGLNQAGHQTQQLQAKTDDSQKDLTAAGGEAPPPVAEQHHQQHQQHQSHQQQHQQHQSHQQQQQKEQHQAAAPGGDKAPGGVVDGAQPAAQPVAKFTEVEVGNINFPEGQTHDENAKTMILDYDNKTGEYKADFNGNKYIFTATYQDRCHYLMHHANNKNPTPIADLYISPGKDPYIDVSAGIDTTDTKDFPATFKIQSTPSTNPTDASIKSNSLQNS